MDIGHGEEEEEVLTPGSRVSYGSQPVTPAPPPLLKRASTTTTLVSAIKEMNAQTEEHNKWIERCDQDPSEIVAGCPEPSDTEEDDEIPSSRPMEKQKTEKPRDLSTLYANATVLLDIALTIEKQLFGEKSEN